MAMFDSFYKFYYWIFNIPYYQVTIVKDMERIKTLIQKVSEGQHGKDIAIIDRQLKKAWWKLDDLCFRDGKKFIMFCDMENAIPLIEDIKVITTGNTFIKEISIKRLKDSQLTADDVIKSGKAKRFVEIYFPPTMLFEKLDAHFVKQTISRPPSVWEEKKWTIIGVAVVIAIIIYMVLASGVLNR